MTQAELFRQVASAGLSGGFAYGKSLPKETGNLDSFKILTYGANQKSTINSLINFLIECFDEKPIRGLELRSRQLKKLIKEVYKKYRYVIIIILNAHLLPIRDIKLLKRLHEICDGPYPGIVLIGDAKKLENKIKLLPEIDLRNILVEVGKKMI